MFLLVTLLSFLAWIGLSDGCSAGLALAQLHSTQLVGQMSNLSRDDPSSSLSNAVNFAAAPSFDPATQVATVSQLACGTFDNGCLWRTSNLSTLPWFQSQYKFDSGVLSYATGTSVQPEGDYAITVSQTTNTTDYAVLESPSFCQSGSGYLQLMLWSSNGVKVQACSKANSATSFDFCTLFMTENQPGPFSVVIPQASQMPMKIYIIATNFNYSDNQYSGGFAAIDQLAYSGKDCSTQTTVAAQTSALPSASNFIFQGSGIMSTGAPTVISTKMSSMASSLPPTVPVTSQAAANSGQGIQIMTAAPTTQQQSTVAPTTQPLATTLIQTSMAAANSGQGIQIMTAAPTTQPPTTAGMSGMAMGNATTTGSTLNVTIAAAPKNETEIPDYVTITLPPNESEEISSTQMNASTFHFSPSENETSSSEVEQVAEESNSNTEASGDNESNGSGSGDNEDSEMLMAKQDDDHAEGSGSESRQDSNYSINDDRSGVDNETDRPAFLFILPSDVTGSPNETTTTQSSIFSNSTIISTMFLNLTTPQPNSTNVLNTNNIELQPNSNLPERIRNLLRVNNPVEEGQQSTTEQSTQQTLLNQLYNGRKTGVETPSLPDESNREELPQIFQVGNRPRPHQQQVYIPTTTQPPWYEFTTLYPGQRRQSQFVDQSTLNNNNGNFYLNSPQWSQAQRR